MYNLFVQRDGQSGTRNDGKTLNITKICLIISAKKNVIKPEKRKSESNWDYVEREGEREKGWKGRERIFKDPDSRRKKITLLHLNFKGWDQTANLALRLNLRLTNEESRSEQSPRKYSQKSHGKATLGRWKLTESGMPRWDLWYCRVFFAYSIISRHIKSTKPNIVARMDARKGEWFVEIHNSLGPNGTRYVNDDEAKQDVCGVWKLWAQKWERGTEFKFSAKPLR